MEPGGNPEPARTQGVLAAMEYQRPPEPAQTRAIRYLRRAAQLREMARVVADKSAKEALAETADEYAALAQAVRLFRKHERLTN